MPSPSDDRDVDDRTGAIDSPETEVLADVGSGPPARDAHAPSLNRCDELRLESGDLVVDDGGSRGAWLRSSVAVHVAAFHRADRRP